MPAIIAPCCGGPLKFSGESCRLECAACGNNYEPEALEMMAPEESGDEITFANDAKRFDIRQRERKINGFTEKLTNKPNNISMKQARRHTTIQLDIIHTGGCLEILKILPDSSVHCCMTFPPYLTLPFFQRCNIVRIEVSSGVYAAVNLTDI